MAHRHRSWLALVAVAALAGCADRVRPAAAAPRADDAAPVAVPAADAGTAAPVRPPSTPALTDLSVVPAAALAEPRYHHSATRLGDGRVLVFGGEARAGQPLASGEVFDPVAGTWSTAGANGPPAAARTRHTGTRLPASDGAGRVLLVGGRSAGTALATAEIYDAASDRFEFTGLLGAARSGHTATPLPDGRVLIVGGQDDRGEPLATLECYDPVTGLFSEVQGIRLAVARAFHAIAALADGRLLITGGVTSADGAPLLVTDAAEILTPAPPGGTWTLQPTFPMAAPRAAHTATRVVLGDARELVVCVGGTSHWPEPHARDDAEVFDPATGEFAPLGARMATPRSGHTATALDDHRTILVIGGATAPHPDLCPVTVGIECFVPDALGGAPEAAFGGLPFTALFVQPLGADGAPVGLPETAQGLTAHTASLLADGRVLVAGGADCAFAAPVAVARTALAGRPTGPDGPTVGR